WSIKRSFVTSLIWLALLLLFNFAVLAQTTPTTTPNQPAQTTVIATPNSVDATKPQTVVLSVADATVAGQVARITVAGTEVQFQKNVPTQGSFTITPPLNLS